MKKMMIEREAAIEVRHYEEAEPRRGRRFTFLRAQPLGVAGLVCVLMLVLLSTFGILFVSYSAHQIGSAALANPSMSHLFGTDYIGRDLLSRTLVGLRISLAVAALSTAGSLVVGTTIGVISGYAAGTIDDIVMRIVDLLLAFPGLIWIIALTTIVGHGLLPVSGAIAFLFLPAMIRLARAGVLAEKERDYVEASVATGASPIRTVFRHIVPNATGPLVLQGAMTAGYAVIAEASLSFLGLGIEPPTPSLGNIIGEGRNYISESSGYVLFPALFLVILVFSLQAAANLVSAWLDPHQRTT